MPGTPRLQVTVVIRPTGDLRPDVVDIRRALCAPRAALDPLEPWLAQQLPSRLLGVTWLRAIQPRTAARMLVGFELSWTGEQVGLAVGFSRSARTDHPGEDVLARFRRQQGLAVTERLVMWRGASPR